MNKSKKGLGRGLQLFQIKITTKKPQKSGYFKGAIR